MHSVPEQCLEADRDQTMQDSRAKDTLPSLIVLPLPSETQEAAASSASSWSFARSTERRELSRVG